MGIAGGSCQCKYIGTNHEDPVARGNRSIIAVARGDRSIAVARGDRSIAVAGAMGQFQLPGRWAKVQDRFHCAEFIGRL